MHPFDLGAGNESAIASRTPTTSPEEDRLTKTRILSGTVDYSNKVWKRLRTRLVVELLSRNYDEDNVTQQKLLLDGLLVRDPRRRLTVKEALKSEWIVSDAAELLQAYKLRLQRSI